MVKSNITLAIDPKIMENAEKRGLKGQYSRIFEKALKDSNPEEKKKSEISCTACGQSIHDKDSLFYKMEDFKHYICKPCWRVDGLEIYNKLQEKALSIGVLNI